MIALAVVVVDVVVVVVTLSPPILSSKVKDAYIISLQSRVVSSTAVVS